MMKRLSKNKRKWKKELEKKCLKVLKCKKSSVKSKRPRDKENFKKKRTDKERDNKNIMTLRKNLESSFH